MKKFFSSISISAFAAMSLVLLIGASLTGCGKQESHDPPSNVFIENAIADAMHEEGIEFDRMSDFQFTAVETTEEDYEQLKSKYASKVDFQKVESTFSLTSVNMDMVGNWSAIFVFNSGEWAYSFGYQTDESKWQYQEKQASRVDKQKMLEDLKDVDFGVFGKGYVGDVRYSSILTVEREYDESVHMDTIETSVAVKTDFAEYSIPIKMTYYFVKKDWELGGVEVSNVEDWKLEYNNGSAPDFMSDNVLLSYLTTETNFLTYVCNLEYVSDYKITKESEVASKESLSVIYTLSTTYEYIGTVNYNVEVVYKWLNNEWSDPELTPTVKDADFSEMCKNNWSSDDGSYFKFTGVEANESGGYKLVGQYSTNSAVDINANLNIPLRDNNWDAHIVDINGNQIWDIPSSEFALDLQYGAIIYDNKYFAPVQIHISDGGDDVEEENPTSNVLVYEQEAKAYPNEITRNNLMLNAIEVGYSEGVFTIKGNITNMSDGQSGYRVSAAMFDSDDIIVAEGVVSSGDTMLLPGSAGQITIRAEGMSEEDHARVKKIILYVKN